MSRTWLRRWLGGTNDSRPVRRRPRSVRPVVELLETRELLTVIPPSTNPPTVVVPVSLPPLSVSQADVNLPYTGSTTDPYGPPSVTYLPPGLTATRSGNTVTLSGTPTQPGAYRIRLDVLVITPYSRTDYSGTVGLWIHPPLSLGFLDNSAPWVAGQAGSGTIAINGGTPAYSNLTVSGLPPGLTAAVSANGITNAVTLSGTPTTAGTYNVAVSLQDADGETVRQTYSIIVYLGVSPGTLPETDVGLGYSAAFRATGGSGHYHFTNSGALPPGLSLSSAGVLSGTPTVAGEYGFWINAVDDASPGVTGSNGYALNVNPPLSLGGLSVAQWNAGQAGYSGSIKVSGGTGVYRNATFAGLPPGVSGAFAGGTFTLSGTPTTAGTYRVAVSVQDTLGATVTGTYVLTIRLVLSPGTLPADSTGQSYRATISASGGSGHYSYTLAAGALPAGLSLSSAGVLSGTTTVAGTFSLTVLATDTTLPGATGTASYQLTVILPSPTTLAGKSVTLTQAGVTTNRYGVLTITGLTLQPDGSYNVTATYQTAQYHTVELMGGASPATIQLTGTLSAPQEDAQGNVTCMITLEGRKDVTATVLGVDKKESEHVSLFGATITMTWAQANVSGPLYDCLEDPVTHEPIDPACGSPPASGTFV
jgi:hypothetical protein